MRTFFLSLLICFCSSIDAQDTLERQPFYGDHVFVRFTVDAGITNINPVATNRALFGSGGFDQLMTFGVAENMTFEPLFKNNLFGHDFTWSLHGYVGEKYRTSISGKSMQYKLSGWEFMTSSFGMDLFANRSFDFVIAPGLYFGNLKLYQTNLTDSTEQQLYKNPFVAPMARAEVRVNFGMITIGGRFSYRHDITHDIWQRKSEGLNPIPGYRFRGTQFMFYIGIRGPFV